MQDALFYVFKDVFTFSKFNVVANSSQVIAVCQIIWHTFIVFHGSVSLWTTRRFCAAGNAQASQHVFAFVVVLSHCGLTSQFYVLKHDEPSGCL